MCRPFVGAHTLREVWPWRTVGDDCEPARAVSAPFSVRGPDRFETRERVPHVAKDEVYSPLLDLRIDPLVVPSYLDIFIVFHDDVANAHACDLE
jgi:hypothetical protein